MMGESNCITITDEIEQMVAKAEKHKKEDVVVANCVSTKNGLKSYVYNHHNLMQDEKLVSKFEPADKEKLDKAIQEAISWLHVSQEAIKEECEEKQNEQIANLIM